MPVQSQFNTDRTYPGRWTITFSNPPINLFVPTTICSSLPWPGPVSAGISQNRRSLPTYQRASL